MRMLIIIALLFTFPAVAGEDCIVKKGQTDSSCLFSEDLKEDTKALSIQDIKRLLAKAKTQRPILVKKTSLWDIYEYPPLLVELARQNQMTVNEMIRHLADGWKHKENPFANLMWIDENYDALISTYRAQFLVEPAIDKLVTEIVYKVEEEIEEFLEEGNR